MLPGLFRTLVGLVIAWFVFRFLDRMFGGGRSSAASRRKSPGSSAGPAKRPAKDDHLGEYVDYEEVDGERD